MAVPDSNSVAKEEAPGEDMVESPLQGSKMWFDNCTRVTTMSSIAGMAFGSMRVLSSAHAQGLAVNDVQYLIPQSAISYAVRVGIFTGVFCLSRNYGLTAGQELTAPNEIAASASAGALSGLLMSGAQLRSRSECGCERGCRPDRPPCVPGFASPFLPLPSLTVATASQMVFGGYCQAPQQALCSVASWGAPPLWPVRHSGW